MTEGRAAPPGGSIAGPEPADSAAAKPKSGKAGAAPTRRQLLDTVLGLYGVGLLALLGYPISRFLTPLPASQAAAEELDLGPAEEFARGTARMVSFGAKPVIVVRDQAGTFYALSALCTHLQCVVSYESTTGQILCACHNGRFALSGKNLSGPPPRPLERFAVEIVGGQLILGAS